MITFPFDCSDHQGKQHISPYQQPKCQQSYSDVKPPTINSSFLQYGGFSQLDENCENNLQSYSASNRHRKVKTIHKNEKETETFKKSQFNYSAQIKSEQQKTKNQKQKGKSIIERFVKKLFLKTYIYRLNKFNQIAQKILTENFLDSSNEVTKDCQDLDILFLSIWDISIYLFMVVILIIHPFQIAFQIQISFLISGLILLMIVIELLIFAFQNQQKDNNKIFLKIVMIIIQCVSCSVLQFTNGQIQFVALILFLISFMFKLKEKQDKLQNCVPFDLTVILIVIDLFLLIHYCACIWHFLALLETDSWITELGIEGLDNYTKYCYSFYWSASYLLGVGQMDIQIKTQTEQILTSLVIIASQFLFIYIFFQIGSSNSQQNTNAKYQLQGVNQFLRDRKVPYQIQYQVRSNLRNVKQDEFDSNQMLNVLSKLHQRVKGNLQYWMRAKALQSCNLLNKFSPITQRFLINQIKYINHKNCEVFKQTDQSLYIIENGQIEVFEYGKCVKILKSGDYFGEYSFFSGQEVKTMYKAVESTQMYVIDQQQFLTFIQQNKQDHEIYMFMKHSLLNGNYSIINYCCLSCTEQSHLISNCPLLNYKPNIIKLIQQVTHRNMERQNYQRCNHKEKNKAFEKIALNFEALKLIRMKYEYFSDDDTSESEQESEKYFSSSNQDWSSDQYYSSNLASDQNKDGTTISIRKQDQKKTVQKTQKGSEDLIKEEIQIMGPSAQSIILNTPQFQQRDMQFLQSSSGSEQQIRFTLSPKDVLKNSQYKQDQVQQSLPSIDYNASFITNQKNNEKQKNEQMACTPDRVKKNQTKNKEEDPDSLRSLQQRSSEDQLSVPMIKYTRNSTNSIPSKRTINKSNKKFSTKLSTIKQDNTSSTNLRTDFDPFTRTKLQFPTVRVVDLSMYNSENNAEQEFEVMYIFTIYFPLWNVNSVIRRFNNYIRIQNLQRIQSDQYSDVNSPGVSQNINKYSFSQL